MVVSKFCVFSISFPLPAGPPGVRQTLEVRKLEKTALGVYRGGGILMRQANYYDKETQITLI